MLSFGARRWSFETWPSDAQLAWTPSRHGLALTRHGRDVQPTGYPLGIFQAEAVAKALTDILAARTDRFPGWWDALPSLRYHYDERYVFLRPTRYAPRQDASSALGLHLRVDSGVVIYEIGARVRGYRCYSVRGWQAVVDWLVAATALERATGMS